MTKITSLFKKSFSALVMFSTVLVGAQEGNSEPITFTPTRNVCELPQGEYIGQISVPRASQTAARMDANGGGSPCTTFVVSYNGFTPEAQAAFQFAVDIWANSLESSVPINVTATFTNTLPPGTLGGAGPATFLTITSGAPGTEPNTFYPAALWEKIEGADRSIFGGTNDINADFNSEANWYYGTDANPPAGQIDFVTVVLHELGHGLGFTGGWADVTPSFPDDIGSVREPNNNIPAIYPHFIENGSGAAILSFTDPSAALGTELTSNDLFCNAPTAIAQLNQGGALPKIYAPSSWAGGSSFSHWDTATFPVSDINGLMRHEVGAGQANHNPGPITLGFFQDMGWSICPGALSTEEFDVDEITVSPNPFTSDLEIRLVNGFNDDYSIDFYDINGRVILSKSAAATDGSISVTGLSTLQDALYFVKITNNTLSTSVTKKLMKR